MHKLEDKLIPETQTDISNEDILILDDNVLLHSLVSIPENFGQLARIMFNCLLPSKKCSFRFWSWQMFSPGLL